MELIIAEKPQVAAAIAEAIGESIKKEKGYIITNDYYITWCIGHLLEIMFSLNQEDANRIMSLIVFLFKNKLIDDEDIKHGIVLGLVNFKNNIIDYPNTKEYFQKFINDIKENNIIDEKILKVYQRTCDNLEKCYE